ncbi:MAG: hypothetical protein QXP66_01005 [Candidatus Aenigmatarchaeota archaeon]
MKYIIFNNKYPVIFPDFVSHLTMTNKIMELLNRELGITPKVTSAGFISADSVKCYGESMSLETGPGQEDSKIILYHFKKKEI